MTSLTESLTEFLLARITEDENKARECEEWPDCFACPTHETFNTARVLAECAAKRRIVEHHAPYAGGSGRPTLLLLALPYADHPDYDETWRV